MHASNATEFNFCGRMRGKPMWKLNDHQYWGILLKWIFTELVVRRAELPLHEFSSNYCYSLRKRIPPMLICNCTCSGYISQRANGVPTALICLLSGIERWYDLVVLMIYDASLIFWSSWDIIISYRSHIKCKGPRGIGNLEHSSRP